MTSNIYATLQEYKDYCSTTDTDATDDALTLILLESASRWIDSFCGRHFYPRIETRYYDVPDHNGIFLDADLLAVSLLKNGDSDTISSSDYTTYSANFEPKWGLKLKDNSTLSWVGDTDGSDEQAIALTATWGYHNEYTSHGWTLAGTLSADQNISALTFAASNNHTLLAQQIAKIDSELYNIASISSSDTIAVNKRGDNGSTAATHTSGTSVYYWNVQPDVKLACLELAKAIYNKRSGQNVTGTTRVTAAGVVITPSDMPDSVKRILEPYRRVE